MWSFLATTLSIMAASFFPESSLEALGRRLRIFTDGLRGREGPVGRASSLRTVDSGRASGKPPVTVVRLASCTGGLHTVKSTT